MSRRVIRRRKVRRYDIALKIHPGEVAVNGEVIKMRLPKGCIGVLFCFESKSAAADYWGEDIETIRVEKED